MFEVSIAKGGSKLKPTAYPDAPPIPPAMLRAGPDRDGYPQIPEGYSAMTGLTSNGLEHWVVTSTSMEVFINQLRTSLGTFNGPAFEFAHIVDKTGLTGKYDFRVEFSVSSLPSPVPRTGDPGGGPDIIPAIEQQLGLKIQKVRAEFPVIVIDSVERAPAEN